MNRPTLWTSIALAGALLAMSRHAIAESSADPQSFLREAAAGGLVEVQLGTLAMQKAQSPAVRAFARRMVDDHSKSNDELKHLAATKGVPLPAAVDDKQKLLVDRLEALANEEFDKAYIEAMTSQHAADVDAFKAATKLPDPDVAAFASRTLPTLEEHLKEVQRVRAGSIGMRSARDPETRRAAAD